MNIPSLLARSAWVAVAFTIGMTTAVADPLPSWNDTEAKDRIIGFVDTVTDTGSTEFVATGDRIAVFDNDGTLWAEQPAYFQLLFALDQLQEMAAEDPSILSSDALKAAAEGDMKTLMAGGEKALLEVINITHSGMSVGEFQADVTAWMATAKHPTTGLGFSQMTYQPMIELLRYLRLDHGLTLLTRSNLKIQKISELCGFVSPFHFSRCFKQVYGHSPSALRQQVMNGKRLPPGPVTGLQHIRQQLLAETLR